MAQQKSKIRLVAAWGKSLSVTKQKSGRVVVYVVRLPEGEVTGDELKGMTRSVYRDGTKARVWFQPLDEDGKVLTDSIVDVKLWIRNVGVRISKEGRQLELKLAFPEDDIEEGELINLIECIDTDGSHMMNLEIEPVPASQVTIDDKNKEATGPQPVATN